MLSLLVLVSLTAAPPPLITLGAPDFTTLNVTPELSRFASEHLAQQLNARGVRVITSREIGSLLGMQRQKELLGCNDAASSCIAELASALGSDGVLLGDLGKLGGSYQINLKVLDAVNGALLAQLSVSVAREEDLLPELTRAAKELAQGLDEKLKKRDAPLAAPKPELAVTSVKAPALTPAKAELSATGPRPSSLRRWAWAPAAVGLAFAGVGTVSYLNAEATHRELTVRSGDETMAAASADEAVRRGEQQQTLALAGWAIGAAGLAAGAAMYFLGGEVQPAVSIAPGSVAIGVHGVLP